MGDNKLTFKNRLLVAPMMHPASIDVNGVLTLEGVEFCSNFAIGGFASFMLPMEIPANGGHARSMILDNEETIPFMEIHRLQHLAHAYNCNFACEIYHAGICMQPGNGRKPMTASDMMWNGHFVPGMTYQEMDEIADLYAKSAHYAKRAGFDFINLHFAHGWLINNFLSPLSNKRTDEFGGSVENRCRFPLMIIDRIREAIGDMPIELRLNGWDSEDEPGGITPGDAVEQVLIFQDKVDMIHMCCGNRLSASSRPEMYPSHFLEPGHNVFIAEKAKKAGAKIPIGAVGNLHEAAFIEQVLAEGKVDYIMMARQANVDQHWANKVKENREEDIRPCILCNTCADAGRRPALTKNVTYSNEATYDVPCAVNPLGNLYLNLKMIPTPAKMKKVAVVGGGVAGMVAAIAAAKRGHDVTLFEKNNFLGGQIIFSDYEEFKGRIKAYRQYLITQLEKSSVKVVMNTEATAEQLEQSNYDAVIVAIGSCPAIPPIKGISSSNVLLSMDVFGQENGLGKEVVILGGGILGCEMAIHVSDGQRKVTVVEMKEYLAENGLLTQRMATLREMDKHGVVGLVNSKCIEITDEGVYVETNGERSFITADSIIVCAGSKPLIESSRKFDDCAFEVSYAGDCQKAADICYAVHSGYAAGATI